MSFETNARRKYLSYTLFDALDDENLRNVEYLLTTKRANPNGYLDDLDLSPMHCAVGKGTEEFGYRATYLCLKFGGDPNIRNSEGITPLHIAAIWGRRKIAELLLEYGGDPYIKDFDGNNALELALANKQAHVYSKFVLHFWTKSSGVGSMKGADSLSDEKFPHEHLWQDNNEESERLPPSNDFDRVSFSDIDSELNFIKIFVPNTPQMSLSSLSDVSSLKRSSSDVSEICRIRNSQSDSTSTLRRSKSFQSLPSVKSEGSAKSWATDFIRAELKRLNMFHGPVVRSTKRLYVRQLRRYTNNPERFSFLKTDDDGFNEMIASTFGPRLPELLSKWSPLIDEMIYCANQGGRGSKERCFFTYVLLDPLITCNLPARIHNLTQWEAWTIFVKSIFYIGKGKNSRPMAHLYDAIKTSGRQDSDKVGRIRHIWSVGAGVVSLQAFHSLTEAEAYNREAAMIDALHGYSMLTNKQAGDYSGKIRHWPMKQKRRLGISLLYRILQIYVADSERQILPSDLKS